MNQNLTHMLKQLKLVVCDVDGVLTDGTLWFSATGQSLKAFHVHDGLGLKRLIANGVEVAIITTCSSPAISQRMDMLGVKHVYLGQTDKLPAFDQLINKLAIKPEQTAYIGDDLPDLPIMKRVGLAVAVDNAVAAVKAQAHYKTSLKGGQGAVREFCDMVVAAQTPIKTHG